MRVSRMCESTRPGPARLVGLSNTSHASSSGKYSPVTRRWIGRRARPSTVAALPGLPRPMRLPSWPKGVGDGRILTPW